MFGKQPWMRQKPSLGYGVDESSPFAVGLIGCFLFNEGTGSGATNLVTNKSCSLQNGVWSTENKGIVTKFSGTNSGIISDNLPISNLPKFINSPKSIAMRVYLYDDMAVNQYLLCKYGGTGEISIAWRWTEQMQLFQNGATVDNKTYNSTAGTAPKQNWLDFVFTDDGDFGSLANTHMYINGKEISGTGSATNGATGYAITSASVSMYTLYDSDYNNGYLSHAMFAQRQWSSEEVAELYRQPYAMIEGYNFGRYFSIASGKSLNII